MLEMTLETPVDCKEIKPVNPKGNQSWIFTGRTDAEAEVPLLWPPDAKSWPWCEELTDWKRFWCWERLKARKRWGWQRKSWLDGITDSMDMSLSKLRRWWRTGKPGVLQSMGGKELDSTEWLNNMGLSCCMLDFSLQCLGLVALKNVGILVPLPETKPRCPALEGGFLTTRPAGKSLRTFLLHKNFKENEKAI